MVVIMKVAYLNIARFEIYLMYIKIKFCITTFLKIHPSVLFHEILQKLTSYYCSLNVRQNFRYIFFYLFGLDHFYTISYRIFT